MRWRRVAIGRQTVATRRHGVAFGRHADVLGRPGVALWRHGDALGRTGSTPWVYRAAAHVVKHFGVSIYVDTFRRMKAGCSVTRIRNARRARVFERERVSRRRELE